MDSSLQRLHQSLFSADPIEQLTALPTHVVWDAVSTCLACLDAQDEGLRNTALTLVVAFIGTSFGSVDLTRRYETVELANNTAAYIGKSELGDRTLNLTLASNILSWGLMLSHLSYEQEAVLRTNKALSLLDRGHRGDQVEAISHLQRAFALRDRDKDPKGSGFTVLNLGLAHARQEPAPDHDAAIRAYGDAASCFARARDHRMMAAAQYNLGAEKYARWCATPSTQREVSDLEQAVVHLQKAAAQHAAQGADGAAAIAEKELACVLLSLGDAEKALSSAEAALRTLSAEFQPEECLTAASVGAQSWADRGAWGQALPYYRLGVECVRTLLRDSVNPLDRLATARLAPLLPRLAAYCALSCDASEEGIDILESLRAVELHGVLLWESADLNRLRRERPELLARFLRLSGEGSALRREQWMRLGKGEYLDRSHEVVHHRAVGDLLATVRTVPGLENFFKPPTAQALAKATTAEWPLVYILTAPAGSYVVVVRDESFSVRHADNADGATVAKALIGNPEQPGLIRVIAGASDETSQALSLLHSVGLLELASIILDTVGDVKGMTLVPTGLLSLVPWVWLMKTGLGAGQVPAIVTGISGRSALLTRGREPSTDLSLAPATLVGDPSPLPDESFSGLPAARAEIAEIGEILDEAAVRELVGEDATVESVREAISGAALVHLACHSAGGHIDESPLEWGLVLANGRRLSVRDILADGGLYNSLVVLSACQTASYDLETPDEALGMPAAFLAAGARTVVSTLWPVDDYVTALFMTQLYESLANINGPDPRGWTARTVAQRLQETQDWVRTLSREQEDLFLSAHPGLARYRGRRESDPKKSGEPVLPYCDPKYWAGFLASGG